MLLHAEHITKTIGTRTLFADIDLTLYPGDKVGLVGRNGVGKTTFLKLIAEPQRDGDMRIRHFGNIGYLPQDPRIDDNVDLDKSVVDHVISSLNLDAERDELAELLAAMEKDPTRRRSSPTPQPRSATPTRAATPPKRRPDRSRAASACARSASTRRCTNSPEASCAWPRSPASSLPRPTRCCSTSRPTTSTPTPASGCSTSCATTAAACS